MLETLQVILIAVSGLLADISDGDSCVDALHSLRVEKNMEIESTETFVYGEQHVLAYTLTEDNPPWRKKDQKTALLVCGYGAEL